MKKDAQLVLRLLASTKKELERIAALEGRSTAQISEAFLQAGIENYRKSGSKGIQKWVSREPSKS